jgi:hypothetical protein
LFIDLLRITAYLYRLAKLSIENILKMKNESEIEIWNELKRELKQRYPMLTNADLQWRNSSQSDLLHMIADKLGKSNRELIEEFQINVY